MIFLATLFLALCACTLASDSNRLTRNLHSEIGWVESESESEENGESEESSSSFNALLQSIPDDSTPRHHCSETAVLLPKIFSRLPSVELPKGVARNPITNTQKSRVPLRINVTSDGTALPSPMSNGSVLKSTDILKRAIEPSRPLLVPIQELQMNKAKLHPLPDQWNKMNCKSAVRSLVESLTPSKTQLVQTRSIDFDSDSLEDSVDTVVPLSRPAIRPYSTFQPFEPQMQQRTARVRTTTTEPFGNSHLRETRTNPQLLTSCPEKASEIRLLILEKEDNSSSSAQTDIPVGHGLDMEKTRPTEYVNPKVVNTRSAFGQSSSSEATIEKSPERAIWSGKAVNPDYTYQTTVRNTWPSAGFSQRHYYGTIKPNCHDAQITSRNTFLGCRITYNRMLFLDGYKIRNPVKRDPDFQWAQHSLDEETLKIETFKTMYPLEDDGLVVSLHGKNQLIMASYGLPPLGVILLRPYRRFLLPIARSIDDTVKTHNVQNGDVVVVGPLEAISQLELKDFQLLSKDAPKKIVKKVYNHSDGPLCVVATISIRQ